MIASKERVASLALVALATVNAGVWAVLAIEGWPEYALVAGGISLALAIGAAAFHRASLAFAYACMSLVSMFLGFAVLFCADYRGDCSVAEHLSVWLFPIGLAGLVGGVVVGLALTTPAPLVADPSNSCRNCGVALYAQWWDKSEGGFVCRRCGALNQPATTTLPHGNRHSES